MAAIGVLIVDDNLLFLEAARDRLEQGGLRVVGVAATSAEALRRAEELRPEVVLVDVMLGTESGFEVARRLALPRADTHAPAQPTAAMACRPASRARPSDRPEAGRAGLFPGQMGSGPK